MLGTYKWLSFNGYPSIRLFFWGGEPFDQGRRSRPHRPWLPSSAVVTWPTEFFGRRGAGGYRTMKPNPYIYENI